MDHLERIVGETRAELARRRAAVPQSQLERLADRRRVAGGPRPFASALAGAGLSLIAEHKRRSPSAGAIREGSSVAEVVGAYERGGAAALSVLTDGPSFGGSLEDIGVAREASSLPILRKDFIVDAYQLYEAIAAGADAVLLIVAALGADQLQQLLDAASRLGLAALVEVHDARELDTALAAGASIVGINNRNLITLEVDTGLTFALLDRIPAGVVKVAESGLRTRAQLDQLELAGVDAVLIGEALMRAQDVESAVRELTAPTMLQ